MDSENPSRTRRLGMFEKVHSPDTGQTYEVVSGRGKYNTIQASDGTRFKANTQDVNQLDFKREYAHVFNASKRPRPLVP